MSDLELISKLSDVEKKLDVITTILKISSRKAIAELKTEIENDSVMKEIIQAAKGIPYNEVLAKTAERTGVSERTVKRRLAELRNLGIIVGVRTEGSVNLHLTELWE